MKNYRKGSMEGHFEDENWSDDVIEENDYEYEMMRDEEICNEANQASE